MENTAAHFFGRAPQLPDDKLELFEKAQIGIAKIYALCAEGKEENQEQIENEIQGWIATLIYAGYSHNEIISAFQSWQTDFEKENRCIDEELNKIFDPSASEPTAKNNKLYENMIVTWIENG